MKILWIDTETTGLNPVKHDPIQIAGLVEIDGVIKEEFDIKAYPLNIDNCTEESLAVSGISWSDLKTFQPADQAKKELEVILSKYIDKYNKNDKFQPAGFNVRFDLEMMKYWFSKQGDQFWGSWVNHYAIDPLYFVNVERAYNGLNLPSHKLSEVCAHYGIKIEKAHDALYDIKATRALFNKLFFNVRVGL